MASLGALDAFPKGAQDDPAMCLRSEEIALAAPVATHAPGYLYRLLRAAATRGLLDWHPDRDDCFTLTALGVRFQRYVHALYMNQSPPRPPITTTPPTNTPSIHSGSPFYPQALWHDDETVRVFFGGLHTALRTGGSVAHAMTRLIRSPHPSCPLTHLPTSQPIKGQLPFSAAHNTNATLWEYLQLHPCRRALFDATLTRVTEAAAPTLAEAVDEAVAAAETHQAAKPSSSSLPTTTALARPGKYVCDVGGGGGGGVGVSPLLSAVLARHPGARGLVYDLAEAARDDTLPPELELDVAVAEAAVLLTGAGGGGGMSTLLHNLWPGLAKRGTSLADARRRIKRVSGSFLDRDETMAKLGGGRCDLFLLKVSGRVNAQAPPDTKLPT